jgi:EmrB/QacA subfamily drug resistance transporter
MEKQKFNGAYVLIATISASVMGFIMASALNVSLPAIQDDLNANSLEILWIVNLYNLLLGALILVGGALGDTFGRKRIFQIGIVIFTIGSVLCGLAPNASLLILARGVQGLGGALMVPGSLAIISALFEGEARGKAIGTWSSATTLASVIGPLVSGWLADQGAWRGIFFIVIPFALVALWALQRVPENSDPHAPRNIDLLGTLFVALGLGAIVYGATEFGRAGGSVGNSALINAGFIIVGVILLGVFGWIESRVKHPLIPLSLFNSRIFSGLNLMTATLYGALSVSLLFFSLFLVQAKGYSASESGLALLPISIMLILLSRRVGQWSGRHGARLPLVVGCALMGVSYALTALPMPDGMANYFSGYFWLVLVLGVGLALIVAPLTISVLGAAPNENAGVASGFNNAVSRASGVVVVAIVGGIALSQFASTLPQQLTAQGFSIEQVATISQSAIQFTPPSDMLETFNTQQSAMTTAYQLTFTTVFNFIMLASAGLALISAVIAWFSFPMRKE